MAFVKVKVDSINDFIEFAYSLKLPYIFYDIQTVDGVRDSSTKIELSFVQENTSGLLFKSSVEEVFDKRPNKILDDIQSRLNAKEYDANLLPGQLEIKGCD